MTGNLLTLKLKVFPVHFSVRFISLARWQPHEWQIYWSGLHCRSPSGAETIDKCAPNCMSVCVCKYVNQEEINWMYFTLCGLVTD